MDLLRQIILYQFSPPVIVLILALMLFLSKSAHFKGPVIFLNILISLRYILWRSFFTLNAVDYIAISISFALFGAEVYGFLQNFFFYYQSFRESNPALPAGGAGYRPTVDIFITIFNEPKEILLRTIIGCQAQDYPKDKFNVYILDDGAREEIKELALRLNCKYLARNTNEDAKAGNLNYGLQHSQGGLVAIFDCDHIPVRSFLKETVGFFADPKVAIVQIPHHFYNPDTFQRNLRLEKEITNEQDLFFHVIQPGRDRHNSAFFAGSCGVLRRSALDGVGGIITRTITEDLHTSMVLHSKGYKSVFINKDLSAGLAPESCAGYLRQRQRWTKGGIQVFILDNPLIKRGLSLHQRIEYFASVIYFFNGIPRIVYLSAPLAYLLFRYPPIVTDIKTLLAYFVPHYLAMIIAFNMVSKGYRNPFWSDVYETLMSFVLTTAAVKTVLRPWKHIFKVTPKGLRHERLSLDTPLVMPHMMLACLLALGAGMGINAYMNNEGDYGALVISLVWGTYNTVLLAAAVISARERPQRRGNIRLARSFRCDIYSRGEKISCVTTDISETGLSARLKRPAAFDSSFITLDLISSYGEVTHLKGHIVRNDRDRSGEVTLGINFLDMDEELYHSVIRHMFSPEDSWRWYHNEVVSIRLWRFFTQVLKAFSSVFKRENILRRVAPRYFINHDCEVVVAENSVRGTVMDVSMTGFSVEIESSWTPRSVILKVKGRNGPPISAKGDVKWQVRKRKKRLLGVKCSDPEEAKALYRELKPF